MKREIKKQLWLSKEENDRLKESARKTCLTEAGYIRMLLRSRVPKEKPDAEFYEVMRTLSDFTEQLQDLSVKIREAGTYDTSILQEEIKRWHQFQLDVEKRFLLPEDVKWP